MPATVRDAFEALIFSARSGFRSEKLDVLRRRALTIAGASHPDAYEATRLPAEGRGNLGLHLIRAGDTTVFQKTTLNTREYRVAQALAAQGSSDGHPAVYLCAARGPVLHIFQEYIDAPSGPMTAELFADVACTISRLATRQVPEVAPSRLDWFVPLLSEKYQEAAAAATGVSKEALQRRLTHLWSQPRAVVHNDLQPSNIRRRGNGQAVAIDLGGIGWSLQGSEFYRLLPRVLARDSDLGLFDTAIAYAAQMVSAPADDLRGAALGYAAARKFRSGSHRRDPEVLQQSYLLAARLTDT